MSYRAPVLFTSKANYIDFRDEDNSYNLMHSLVFILYVDCSTLNVGNYVSVGAVILKNRLLQIMAANILSL